jgi:hypothetical protein
MNTKIVNLEVQRPDGTEFKAEISDEGLRTNFFTKKEFHSYDFPKNWWGKNIEWDEFVNLVEENDDADAYWHSLLKLQLIFIRRDNFKNN